MRPPHPLFGPRQHWRQENAILGYRYAWIPISALSTLGMISFLGGMVAAGQKNPRNTAYLVSGYIALETQVLFFSFGVIPPAFSPRIMKITRFLALSAFIGSLGFVDHFERGDALSTNSSVLWVGELVCFAGLLLNAPLWLGWMRFLRQKLLPTRRVGAAPAALALSRVEPYTLSAWLPPTIVATAGMISFLAGIGHAAQENPLALSRLLVGYAAIVFQLLYMARGTTPPQMPFSMRVTAGSVTVIALIVALLFADRFRKGDAAVEDEAGSRLQLSVCISGSSVLLLFWCGWLVHFRNRLFPTPEAAPPVIQLRDESGSERTSPDGSDPGNKTPASPMLLTAAGTGIAAEASGGTVATGAGEGAAIESALSTLEGSEDLPKTSSGRSNFSSTSFRAPLPHSESRRARKGWWLCSLFAQLCQSKSPTETGQDTSSAHVLPDLPTARATKAAGP